MDDDAELITFAKKIYLEESKNCRTTMVFYTSDDKCDQFFGGISHNIQTTAFEIIQIKNFSLELVNDFMVNDERADLTIFLLDDSDVVSIVFALESFQMWNIRSKTLVVLSGVSSEDYEAWLKESFDTMWEKQVLRLLIAFYLEETFKVVTYDPFLEQYNIDITHTNTSAILSRKIRNMHLFPLKFFYIDNVYKVPRFASRVINGKTSYQGLDGKFMGTFVEAMNATVEMHTMSEHFSTAFLQGNSRKRLPLHLTWMTLKSVYDFDILTNSMRIYQICMDHVFLNERNDFWFILPSGAKIPQYLVFMQITLEILLPITISFTLVTVSMGIIKKIHFSKSLWTVLLFDNLHLMLSGSVPDRKRHSQENFILMLWICSCLIFDAWFTSILTSTLVIPKFYPDVHSLEALYKSNLKIYSPPFTALYIEHAINDSRLKKHLVYIPANLSSFGEDLFWIKDYRQYGLLLLNNQVSLLKQYELYSGRSPYYIMKESPLPSPTAYSIPKDKFYYREFQEIAGTIQEAGLPIYWKRYNYDLPSEKHLIGTPPDEERDIAEAKAIGIQNLQTGLMLFVYLQTVAIMVFILELISHSIIHKIRNLGRVQISSVGD